jgi:drug/metabolite transporter (DMT)-like permease
VPALPSPENALLPAFAAIAVASLGWAALDALRKALTAHVRPVPLAALLAAGQLPLFATWVFLSGETRVAAGYVLPGAATIALNVAANLLFLHAVHVSPLSATIPFRSFTPVFATAFSAVVLGERPDPSDLAGIVLVVLGGLFVNLRWDGAARSAALLREPGSLMMTGVALLWSLTSVLDKRALAFAGVPTHAAIQCGGVALVLLLVLAARGRLADLRVRAPARGRLAFALVAAGVGLSFQFLALRLTLVGLVEALKRSIGMLFAVGVGRLAFGEPLTAGKIAGVILMSTGVALIVL